MDLFPLSAAWPFQIPNPRVCITSDKAEPPGGGGRDGGGGDGREGEWELTAPLPEGLPPPKRTSQGQTQV